MASLERILIVGVGNLLLGDEGLGIHVARALAAAEPPLPPAVEVVDAGTALLDLVPALGNCDRAILVDAIQAGGEPGTIYRYELGAGTREPEGTGVRPALSLHEVAVDDALGAAWLLGVQPRHLELIGAEPASLEPGIVLSPALARAAEMIVTMLERQVRDQGGSEQQD